MGKEENLRMFTSDQSREEAAINGAKGGKRSGEVRAARRDLRKALEALLDREYKDVKGNAISGAEAIALKQMEKALRGDTKAFEVVRDTVGQKPVDKVVVAEVDQAVIDEIEIELFK